jgi:hypothetical protein
MWQEGGGEAVAKVAERLRVVDLERDMELGTGCGERASDGDACVPRLAGHRRTSRRRAS